MKKPFVPDLLPIVLTAEDRIHLYKLAIDARVKIERFNALLERSIINQAGSVDVLFSARGHPVYAY